MYGYKYLPRLNSSYTRIRGARRVKDLQREIAGEPEARAVRVAKYFTGTHQRPISALGPGRAGCSRGSYLSRAAAKGDRMRLFKK